MKTVKNLYRVLCILVVLVSFTNCQNDTVSEIQQEESVQLERPFKTSLLAKQDMETNSKLYNQMRSLTAIQSNSIAKNAYNGVYDFTIDTDVVQFIESTNSNSHSYTLPIERMQPTNKLENLVFTYDASVDDYTSSIVTYHFTAAQKQEFLAYGYSTTDYSVSHQPIYINIDDVISKTAMPIPCSTSFTVYHITPDTGETFYYGTNGIVHNACQHEEEQDTCETFTVIEIDCPDGGSVAGATHSTSGNTSANTTGSNNHSNAGGSSGSGSGTTTSGSQDSVITSPIAKDELQQITQTLNEVLGEGNWEMSEDNNVGDDVPNFESAEELQAFLDSLVSGNFTQESSELLEGATRRDSHTMNFSSFPSATIRATVKLTVPQITMPLAPSDILSVRSTVHGNTSFYKWTQLDSEDMSDNNSPQIEVDASVNSLRIRVEGSMEVGFRFFGTFFTTDQSITIKLVYDLTTAQLHPYYSLWYYND